MRGAREAGGHHLVDSRGWSVSRVLPADTSDPHGEDVVVCAAPPLKPLQTCRGHLPGDRVSSSTTPAASRQDSLLALTAKTHFLIFPESRAPASVCCGLHPGSARRQRPGRGRSRGRHLVPLRGGSKGGRPLSSHPRCSPTSFSAMKVHPLHSALWAPRRASTKHSDGLHAVASPFPRPEAAIAKLTGADCSSGSPRRRNLPCRLPDQHGVIVHHRRGVRRRLRAP